MSTDGAFVVPFRILSRKTQDGKELVRLMGGNNFKSLPQNGILVPLLFNISGCNVDFYRPVNTLGWQT